MIGRTLGHYQILAKLGEGGMGVVYKAHDSHLHRPVAIKVLPPDLVADAGRRQRFTQEARAASALNHPGIVTIHDIAHADGTDFIAMEYVEGKTLAELIRRGGLSLKDVLRYAVQAAAALAKAHAAGIVHRDLKPSNIMVTDDGLVKILDFGVAKLAHSEDVDPGLGATETRTSGGHLVTEAGTVVGTAAYMSPEQAECQKVDARSDIFSFGAVLYEMATGARAFQATTAALTLSAVVSTEPKPPSDLAKDLPRELERIILRCLRKDPARRFQHMEDLAVEIEEIKSESDTQLAAAHTASRSRRTPWVMGSMTAFAVIAATGAWFLWPDRTALRASPTVAPLTTLFGHERFATFSPDGNQVAFAWDGEKGDNTDIYVMPVGAGTPVRLTTDAAQDSAPAWSPDGGRIAFVRRRGSEVAIYLVTPPVVNSEQKLADIRPVDSPNLFTTVSWFPDGRRLAVAERGADGQTNGIVTIPIGRDEPRKLVWTPLSAGTYHYPAVSPDGQSLAYALCRGQFNCNAYVMELARNLPSTNAPQRPLVEQSSFIRGIAWTADGRSLFYGVGSLRSYLWRVPVVGGEPERVELAGVHAAFPAVSRDGLELAYTRLGSGADIWKFGASGLPESFLSSTLDDRNAQFSPDGKKIAFESRRLDKDTQIWIANADGTNATPLTDGADGVGGSPRWSPDSRWIVFDGQERDGQRAIYKVAAEGGRTILLHAPGAVPSWSHDGKWIYFSHGGGAPEQDLWRVRSEGGDAVKVADNAGGNPLESPDGNLYYRKQTVFPGVLFARPRAGGQERRVLESMVATLLHQYFPVEDGIYYVAHPDPKLPFAHEVRFLDFRTGTHKTLHKFEARSGTGLTVSPDRKTIVYSGTKPSDGDNLMLIRNFR